MNKLKFLIIFILISCTAYASEPYVTSDNILYGDTVYFKIPFEYENVYAADIFLTYSDNLEFKDADCGTDGEKAVYEDGKSVHIGFLPNEKPSEITARFKATGKGTSYIMLNEITVVSDELEETTETLSQRAEFEVKSSAPSGGGSGGGGGGGKGSGSSKPSSGSSGGGSSVFIPPVVPVQPEKIEPKLPFGDISDDYWAKSYISDLYEKNIISKDELFRPEDFITRAEFVKLAVTAFGISSEEKQCTFSDVSESDWFLPYVAAAENSGIVTGDNAHFYPQENITREDICVMLYRIIKDNAAEAKTDFADMESVSDYAREAVGKLAGMSVINGNENGEFLPKSFATRAQTAKMIAAALGR